MFLLTDTYVTLIEQGRNIERRAAGEGNSNICRRINGRSEGRYRICNRNTKSQHVEHWMRMNETETRLAMR